MPKYFARVIETVEHELHVEATSEEDARTEAIVLAHDGVTLCTTTITRSVELEVRE